MENEEDVNAESMEVAEPHPLAGVFETQAWWAMVLGYLGIGLTLGFVVFIFYLFSSPALERKAGSPLIFFMFVMLAFSLASFTPLLRAARLLRGFENTSDQTLLPQYMQQLKKYFIRSGIITLFLLLGLTLQIIEIYTIYGF